tara:strand:- start:207 stop:809 length:603 start_codon:yes stop_codon:yes gene_type:complete
MKKVLYLFIIIPLLSLAKDKNSLSIGETLPIPNYKMKSVDGSFYSLNDLKTEEGILVIFTCNTCPFVVMWEDRYKMLEEYCKKNNIGMAYINSNYKRRNSVDSYKSMIEHSKNMNYSYEYLVDNKSKLANTFNAKTTPHIFLFDETNKLIYKGSIDNNYKDKSNVTEFYLKDAMDQMLKNEKIEISITKAIGCSIKRYEN